MKKTILTILLIIVITVPCFAADYYISTSGNDSDPGTESEPWQNLSKIYSSISSNDTVKLKCGDTWTNKATCSQASIHFDTADDSVTIDRYGSCTGNNNPIIDDLSNTSCTPDAFQDELNSIHIPIGNQHIIIKNVTVKGASGTSAVYIQGYNATISDSSLSGAASGSNRVIYSNGSWSFKLQNSTVKCGTYDNGFEAVGGGDHEIYDNRFEGYAPSGAVKISNDSESNKIERNFFIPASGATSGWGVTIRSQSSNTNWVINNVFDLTGATGRAISIYQEASPYDSVYEIFNNSIVSDGSGIGVWSGGAYVKMWNNVFYDLNVAIECSDNSCADDTAYNNSFYLNTEDYATDQGLTYADNVTSNPYLSNASMSNEIASDAELTSSSTALIDAGKSSGDTDLPSIDYASVSRDSNLDIGAFEYTGAAPPPVITTVTVNKNVVTVNFDKTVSKGSGYSGDDSDFNMDCSGVDDFALTYVSGSGSAQWIFNTSVDIRSWQSCDLDFIGGTDSVEDSGGSDLVGVEKAVTNQSAERSFTTHGGNIGVTSP